VKKLGMILILFALWPCMASASSAYTVHLQDSKQPYICVQCDLSTPVPDPKTRDIISAWKEGKAPFVVGAVHSLKGGDSVSVCNGCGCATYTLSDDGIWGDGDFQVRKDHPASTSTTPSQKRVATSG
jgi:hypothetical protein